MADFTTVVRRQLLHVIELPQRNTEYPVIDLRCSKSLDAQSESEKPDHEVLQSVFSVKANTNINGALEVSDQVQACKPVYIQRFGHKTKREITAVGNEMSGLVQVITYRRHTTRRI